MYFIILPELFYPCVRRCTQFVHGHYNTRALQCTCSAYAGGVLFTYMRGCVDPSGPAQTGCTTMDLDEGVMY